MRAFLILRGCWGTSHVLTWLICCRMVDNPESTR
jgi:hypothetical protein